MCEATYEAAVGINRVKAEVGIVDAATAAKTEARIVEARHAMDRIDAIMARPAEARDDSLRQLKDEFDRLSQSTVAEKSELNWPHAASIRHVAAAANLFVRENAANLFARRRGELSPATSDQHPLATALEAHEA